MNTIIINGKVIQSSGSITVINGKVTVDGKDVTPDGKEINIEVNGDVPKLEIDACSKITINGNAGDVTTGSGDVDVTGNVSGLAKSSQGNVTVGVMSVVTPKHLWAI